MHGFTLDSLRRGAETAFVLPTYGAFEYAELAAETFLKYTPGGVILLVDDASPEWPPEWLDDRYGGSLAGHRFEKNGGLTRSWNEGLRAASVLGCKYAIAGNSDILFTPGWEAPMQAAIEAGFSLVGPCSNAPGHTIGQRQNIQEYIPGWRVNDSEKHLEETAAQLALEQAGRFIDGPINGFFMYAKVTEWWKGAYSDEHVFRPVNLRNSRGQINPTPLMTLNEDELTQRWRGMGRRIGAVPASFIFHYRAVSRGERFRSQGSFRRSK